MRRNSGWKRLTALATALVLLCGNVFFAAGDDAGSSASFYSEWFSLDNAVEITQVDPPEEEPEAASDMDSDPEQEEAPEADSGDGAEEEPAGESETVPENIEIRNPRISVSFLSGADSVANGDKTDLVWTADTNRKGHEFTFRVDYSFSTDTEGMKQWEPGQIEIRIPLNILHDRSDKPADDLFVSLPLAGTEGLDEQNLFVYKIEDNQVVIYNRLAVKPTQEGYFELSYSTSKSTYDYLDYLSKKGNGQYASEPLSATLNIFGLKTGEDGTKETDYDNRLCNVDSNEIEVCIDTDAKITSTQKSLYGGAQEWNTDWGNAPQDSGSYKYLMWKVTSNIQATQPFTFSLADSFTPEQGEFVGYLLQGVSGLQTGESVSVSVPSQENMRSTRTDYVITRIQKQYYEDLLNENGSFEVLNQVVASVTPDDGVNPTTQQSDTAPYSERVSTYSAPGGTMSSGKRGLTTSYDLTRLQLGTDANGIDEVSGLQYQVTLNGTTYRQTYDGDPALIDGPAGKDNFGKKSVTFKIDDRQLWLEYEDQDEKNQRSDDLTSEDYRIDALTFSCDVRQAEYSETELSFHSAVMSEADLAAAVADGRLTDLVFTLYSGDEQIGTVTYHFADDTYTISPTSDAIDSADNKTIRLKPEANITGYTAEFSNALYSTNLTIRPSVTLKRSNTVKAILDNISTTDFDAELLNRANFTVSNSSGGTIYSNKDDGTDYLLGDTRGSNITKTYLSRQNDAVRSRYLIVWEAAMEDYYTIRNQKIPVWQESGTFVDLLPDGFVYVPESLICYADDEILQEGQYSVEIVSDNADGAGRALMKVDLAVPAYEYRIVYTTAATWDTIVRLRKNSSDVNSVKAHNAVAYITGNDSIGPRSPDKTYTNETDELIRTTLYGESTGNSGRIISTAADAPVAALVSSSSGLDKLVRATDANSTYRKTTPIYADSEYSYQLHFGPSIGSKADELIVYDFLENYPGTTWRGTLSSVNTDSASAYGANPIVYYCTLDRDAITGKESLLTGSLNAEYNGGKVWSTVSPADRSTITGIAVDLSKTKDDKDFVLEGGQAISIIVYMHSPDSIVMEDGAAIQSAPAYNEVYLHERLADETKDFVEGTDVVISQGHTEVYYRVSGTLELKKIDENGNPIQDISFRLFGTSAYGNEIDTTLTTRADGKAVFEHLEVGTYTLQEASVTPDYLVLSDDLTVVVESNGTCRITNDPLPNGITAPTGNETAYTIINLPRVHGPLAFSKRGRIDGQTELTNPLAGVTFRLSGVSAYGNLIDLYAESDSAGNVSFPDVEMGTYDLTELTTAEHYILSDKTITVTCDADGLLLMHGDDVEQSSAGDYTVYNEPLHTLGLMKVDALNGTNLANAKFQLSGIASDGTLVNMTGISQISGALEFEDLPAGTYLLQETEAPENHLLSDIIYTVLIDNNGEITLSWTDEEGKKRAITNVVEDKIYALGFGKTDSEHPAASDTAFDIVSARFQIPNEREKTGTITIIKKWQDADGNPDTSITSNPVPIVHVDTSMPEAPKTKAVFDRYKWMKNIHDSSAFNQVTSFKQYKGTNPTPETLQTEWEDVSYNNDEFTGKIYVKEIDNTLYWLSDSSEVYLPGSTHTTDRTYNSSAQGFFGKNSDKDQSLPYFTKLTTVDLNGLKADYVDNMQYMFNKCGNLTSVTFPAGFNTSNATSMNRLFNECTSLTTINGLSNLNTSNSTDFYCMFYGCSSLGNIDVSSFQTGKGINFECMFSHCSAMTTIDISGWDMHSATKIDKIFEYCTLLTTVKMEGCNLSGLTSTFPNITNESNNLTHLYMKNCILSNVKTFDNFIRYRRDSITYVDMSGCDLSSLESLSQMFDECRKITYLNLSGIIVTDKLTNLYKTFRYLENLKTTEDNQNPLDLSWLAPAHIANMDNTFARVSKLTTIDISAIDPTYITKFNEAFWFENENNSLQTIYVCADWNSKFNPSNKSGSTFAKCKNLVGGAGTQHNGNGDIYAIIDGGPSHPGYFTAKPTTTNPTTEPTGSHVELSFPDDAHYIASLNPVRMSASSISEDSQTIYFASNNKNENEEKQNTNTTQIQMTTGGSPRKLAEGENLDDVYDQWIVNDDGSWTYRFHAYTDELAYFVYEESIGGFTWIDPSDGHYSTFTYSTADNANNSVTITNQKNGQNIPTPTPPPTVTPTPTPPGSLKISKDITLAAGVSLGQDQGRQFEFEIVLDQNPGSIVNAMRTTAVGTENESSSLFPVSFSSRIDNDKTVYVAIITLGDKESITLQGISAKTGYTVTEKTQDSNFTTTVNSVESSGNAASGDITSSKTSTAAFVNMKNENDPSGGFTLEKQLGTTTVSDDSFSFVLNLYGLLTNTTYSWNKIGADGTSTPQTFTSSSRGTASLLISLKAKERADFSPTVSMLPVGTQYTITELASGLVTSYTITKDSANKSGTIARSSDANSANKTALSTAMETVDKDELVHVVFTNADPSYSIRFQKYGNREGTIGTLSGAFLSLYRLEDVSESNNQETYASQTWLTTFVSSTSSKEFSLKPGEYIIREINAPTGYQRADSLRFRIDDRGFAQYWSVTENGNTITRSDEDSWSAMASNTIMQMIDPYVAPAELEIPVTKTLNGRDMNANEFTFLMTPISANGDRDTGHQVRITNPASDNGKSVTFHFEQELTVNEFESAVYKTTDGKSIFFYVVQEEAGELASVSYDTHQYVVKVTLSLAEGKLSSETLFYLYDGSGPLPSEATKDLPTASSLRLR